MAEDVGLMEDAIAIDQQLARKGGGMRLAFIYAIDVIDADGSSVRYLGSPNGQELYRSLGLNEYLRTYLELEVADEIGASQQGPCDCGCQDDQ